MTLNGSRDAAKALAKGQCAAGERILRIRLRRRDLFGLVKEQDSGTESRDAAKALAKGQCAASERILRIRLSATYAAGIRRVKASLHGRGTIDFQVVGGVSAQASCRSDPLLDDVGTLKKSVSIFDQARCLVFARELFQLGSGSIVFVDVAHFHELVEAEVVHGQ